jgi:gluconolactonase
LLLATISCSDNQQKNQTEATPGNIEIYDQSALVSIDSNASFEIIGTGYNWSEGPVWLAEINSLLFSDVPENVIYRWSEGSAPVTYLKPSGYTDSAVREGENGSNGLTLDNNGRLLLCQSGNRVVARMDASPTAPAPKFQVLASAFNGKKFNSPNDLIIDRHNNIYFTDPIYGLPKGANDPERQLNFEGVYRIDSAGKVFLLIDSIPRPNGIALSPDERTLFIASSDDQRPAWYAYQLDSNHNIISGGLILDARSLKEKATVKQGPDGMKIDSHGNLFCAGPDGVNILSPQGKLLALIRINNNRTSNCAFNQSKNELFVTADDKLIRIHLRKAR